MKLLITGGCGFIGSMLIRHLLEDTTHSIVNLDKLTYAANPAALADFNHHPNYCFIKHDICHSLDNLFYSINRMRLSIWRQKPMSITLCGNLIYLLTAILTVQPTYWRRLVIIGSV